MSTDRELLELAAKAAGIKLIYSQDGIPRNCTGMSPIMNIFSAKAWSPLTDDGDAMQLLLKISNISVRTTEIVISGGISRVRVRDFNCGWEYCGIEKHYDDPDAATRRAIVYAAAEIGRGMKP